MPYGEVILHTLLWMVWMEGCPGSVVQWAK